MPRARRRWRWSSFFIWTTLFVVVFVRYVVLRDHYRGFGFSERQGGRVARQQNFRRPPTPIYKPVAEVPSDLWRLQITIASDDVETLRGYFWNGWQGARQERPEVLATVQEGGVTYTNVAIHLKGAAGSFRPFDDKPALTLHFSKHAPGQKFHGYNKISLNNSVQDPSYLCEAISRELFDAAGVPVPRADHATVVVNGRDLGLYVMTEGFGKPFLRRYFKEVSGNLYDGGFCQEITGYLDTNSGDNPNDRSDLKRLIAACQERDPDARWQRLNEVLDVERFLSLLAMEVMTCHWDGYALNRNNYRVFHNVETDRMIFIPHGLDQMFGTFRSSPTSEIQPAMRGMVAQAVMSIPEGRKAYLARVAELRSTVFLEEKITNRVLELSRRIRPTLAAYGEYVAEQHDHHVAHLTRRIVTRAQSITHQLKAPIEPVEFDEQGVALLTNWSERIATPQPGLLRFEKTEEDGLKLLGVNASSRGGAASWRTRAILGRGEYRFEGRARAGKLTGMDDRSGICLRISGGQGRYVIPPVGEWVDLGYRFRVDEPMQDVELVCELRVSDGEAFFDESSLRLIKQ
ncbi:MAG: CotH kinase family protein [Verrucomicrobiota bacterium]